MHNQNVDELKDFDGIDEVPMLSHNEGINTGLINSNQYDYRDDDAGVFSEQKKQDLEEKNYRDDPILGSAIGDPSFSSTLYPDIYQGDDDTPMERIETEKKAGFCKKCCIWCGVCSGTCCVCYLCCVVLTFVLIFILMGFVVSMYFQCVSGISVTELRIPMNYTSTIILDHYGGVNVTTAEDDSSEFYLIIRSFGKRDHFPNYQIESVDNITRITQNHLYDDLIMNDFLGGIICEGIDLSFVVPKNYDLVMNATTRLISQELNISGPVNMISLNLELPNGGASVNVEKVKVAGTFEYASKGARKVVFSEVEVMESFFLDIQGAEVSVNETSVENSFKLQQKYNGLTMSNVNIGQDSTIEMDYGKINIDNMKSTQTVNLKNHYGDTVVTNFDFGENLKVFDSQYGDFEFQKGKVSGDFELSTKYSGIKMSSIKSDWGKMSIANQYGDMEFKKLERINVEVDTKFSDIKVVLDSNYYDTSAVQMELSSQNGGVKLDDSKKIVNVDKKEESKITGTINQGGENKGYMFKISTSNDNISVKFE